MTWEPDDWWPLEPARLVRLQAALGRRLPSPRPIPDEPRWGGCFVCFGRGSGGAGRVGDPGWASAVARRHGTGMRSVTLTGAAGGPYLPGLLALREGRLLATVVAALHPAPDVLLVNATGRDHPRRAGLAVHLGAALDLPTVGVTHRPLAASGDWPGEEAGASAPLRIGAETVGAWVRTRRNTRPLAVSPGWRTDVESALLVVAAAVGSVRTPEPIRVARSLARRARSCAARAP